MSELELIEDPRVEDERVDDIETKATSGKAASGSGDDVALAFDDFMRAFEAFKAANEERLGQIEKRLSADVLTIEKLDRINSAIDEHKAIVDELALKSARPQLGQPTFRSASTLQHEAAFEAYVRHGEAQGLHKLEEKALSVGSDPDGGYLVPEESEAAVIRGVKNISPIRAIAGNHVVSASIYKKPFVITGPSTGWVAETATRPETNSPTLAELTFPTMELYAMPSATQTLLDDSAVNIEIIAVIDVEERRRWLQCLCEEHEL